MVLILDGACDDGRVGRAVERMWKRRFLSSTKPWSLPLQHDHNSKLGSSVCHLLLLQSCMGQLP